MGRRFWRVAHHIHQGEEGEQGDPLMPPLFALGQHPALVAAQTRYESHKLMAFLDDVCIVSPELDHVGHGPAVTKMFFFDTTRHEERDGC